MHKSTFILMAAALIIIGGCPLDPKNIGTPDSASEATEGTNTSTGTSASPTETSPGPDDTSTTSEPGDPDSGDSDTSTTSEPGDTDTDTDTDTGDEGLCPAADPATAASYTVVLDAWPGQSDAAHDVERSCMVDAVSSDGTVVTTKLTCDVDGVPLGAQFEVSAAPEGEVDWSVGQAVTLRAYRFKDEFGQEIDLQVTLLDDPTALLVHGQDWWGDNVPPTQMLGPILRERTSSCIGPAGMDELSFGFYYSLIMVSIVFILSGHRGALPIDPTHVYAIDLAHSSEGPEPHGSEHSLIRRVKGG
jgi:hypothetical protein